MKTFKTQVYLNQYAEAYCTRCFGVRRVIWNWALRQFFDIKKATGQMPSNYDVSNLYTKCKNADSPDSTFRWILKQQWSTIAAKEVFKDVKQAFALARQTSKKVHHKVNPYYKTKRDRLQTFSYYHNKDSTFGANGPNTLYVCTNAKKKPIILRTAENISWMNSKDVKLCKLTVTKKAGKYWISIAYEKPNHKKKPVLQGKIGIDLGVVKSIVSYDGTKSDVRSFNTERSRHLDRLAKRNDKELSRKKVGSKSYEKLLLLKERRSERAARQRKALLEEYTTFIANHYQEIVIDDFSFKSALKVANPNRAYRCMTYLFKERLAAKCAETGATMRFVEHAKGIKTTKKCHACGSERIQIDKHRAVHCVNCGEIIDRDINAAMNCYKL